MAPIAMNRVAGIVIGLTALSVLLSPVAAAASGGGLLGQLQCPCDCGKYLSVCDCSSADTGRSFVDDLQKQGLANPEIAERYGQQFGQQYVEFVPKEGSGLSLWLTPLAGVVVGAGGIYLYFKRFRGSNPVGSAVSVCPDCGNSIDTGTEYCPECGSNMDESW